MGKKKQRKRSSINAPARPSAYFTQSESEHDESESNASISERSTDDKPILPFEKPSRKGTKAIAKAGEDVEHAMKIMEEMNKTVSLWQDDEKSGDDVRDRKKKDSMSKISSDLGLDDIAEFKEFKPTTKANKIKKKKILKIDMDLGELGAFGTIEANNFVKTDDPEMDILGDLGLDDIDVFKEIDQKSTTIGFKPKPKKPMVQKNDPEMDILGDLGLDDIDVFKEIDQKSTTIRFKPKPKIKPIKKTKKKVKPVKATVTLEGFNIISAIEKLENKSIKNDVELDRRTRQMKDAMNWWNQLYFAEGGKGTKNKKIQMQKTGNDMEDIMKWWVDVGKNYNGLEDEEKRALIMESYFDQIGNKAEKARKKADEINEALRWWRRAGARHKEELMNLESEVGTFSKVKRFVNKWEQKELSKMALPIFDPVADLGKSSRIAEEIKRALAIIFEDNLDSAPEKNLEIALDPLKKIKMVLVNWKKDSVLELAADQVEKALDWWQRNMRMGNPATLLYDEQGMYKVIRQLFRFWGLKEPSDELHTNMHVKEMKDAVILWRNKEFADPFVQEPYKAECTRKMDCALIQIQCDMCGKNSAVIAKEIEDLLRWWGGNSKKNLDTQAASLAELKKFSQIKQLFSAWNNGDKIVENEALKDLTTVVMWWKKNTEKGLNSSLYIGEDLTMFKKFQQILYEWRSQNSSSLLSKHAAHIVRDMIQNLQWWQKTKKQDPRTLGSVELLQYQRLSQIMASWITLETPSVMLSGGDIPEDVIKVMSKPTKLIKEVEEAIEIWQNVGQPTKEFFKLKKYLAPKKYRLLNKLIESVWQWQRLNSFQPLALNETINLIDEIQKTIQWWDVGNVNSFDLEMSLRYINESKESSRVLMAEEAFLLWQNMNGTEDENPLYLYLLNNEAEEIMDKLSGNIVGFINGDDVDIAAVKRKEEKYEKSKRLAQWWGRWNKPINAYRAEKAVASISKILNWNSEKNETEKLADPRMTSTINNMFKIWSPNTKLGSKEVKALTNEINEAFDWWAEEKFNCSSKKNKKILSKLLELTSWSEQNLHSSPILSLSKIQDLSPEKNKTNMEDIVTWFEANENLSNAKRGSNDEGSRNKKEDEKLQHKESNLFNDIVLDTSTAEGAKAKDMEEALGWLRANDFDYDNPDNDEMSFHASKMIESLVPNSSNMSIGEKSVAMHQMVNLLNRPEMDRLNYDELTQASTDMFFRNDNAIVTKEMTKANMMSDALNWLQSNDADRLIDFDDASQMSGGSESWRDEGVLASREVEMSNALNWLRSGDVIDDDHSIALNYGRNASAPGNLKMENALNFLRTNDANNSYINDDGSSSYHSGAKLGVVDNNNWIGKGLTGNRIDVASVASVHGQVLGFGKSSKEEKKARGMESALDWLQSNNPDEYRNDDNKNAVNDGKFGKMELAKDGQWLSSSKGQIDDVSIETEEGLLGSRGRNIDEERKARRMEDALYQLRSRNPIESRAENPNDLHHGRKTGKMELAEDGQWLPSSKGQIDDLSIGTEEGLVSSQGRNIHEERTARKMEDALFQLRSRNPKESRADNSNDLLHGNELHHSENEWLRFSGDSTPVNAYSAASFDGPRYAQSSLTEEEQNTRGMKKKLDSLHNSHFDENRDEIPDLFWQNNAVNKKITDSEWISSIEQPLPIDAKSVEFGVIESDVMDPKPEGENFQGVEDSLLRLRAKNPESIYVNGPNVLGLTGDSKKYMTKVFANSHWLPAHNGGITPIDNSSITSNMWGLEKEEEHKAREMEYAFQRLSASRAGTTSINDLEAPLTTHLNGNAADGTLDVLSWLHYGNNDKSNINSDFSMNIREAQIQPEVDDVVKALELLPSSNDYSTIDDRTLEATRNLAGLPMPKTNMLPDTKANILQKALQRLQSNHAQLEFDDDMFAVISNFAGVPFVERCGFKHFDEIKNPEEIEFIERIKTKTIESALAKLQYYNPELDNAEHATMELLEKISGVTIPSRDLAPDERAMAMEEAVNVLREGNWKLEAEGDSFSRLTNRSFQPGELNMIQPEQKAVAMVDVFNLTRNGSQAPDFSLIDKETLEMFRNIAGLPALKVTDATEIGPTPDQKCSAMKETIELLRTCQWNFGNVEDEVALALTKLAGMPVPNQGLSVEDVIGWLQNNDPDASKVDVPAIVALSEVTGIPKPKVFNTKEKRAATLKNALETFQRNPVNLNIKDSKDFDDTTQAAFSSLRLNSCLPKNIKSIDGIEAIENVVCLVNENPESIFEIASDATAVCAIAKFAGFPMPKELNTHKKRMKSMDTALSSIRKNDFKPHDVGDTAIVALSSLACKTVTRNKLPKGVKVTAMKDALEILSDDKLALYDPPPPLEEANFEGVSISASDERNISFEGIKMNALKQALEHLRNNSIPENLGTLDQDTVFAFNEVCGLPQPYKQLSEEGKIKAIEDIIERLCSSNSSGSEIDVPTAVAMVELAGLPLPKGFDPQRGLSKTLFKATEWLRDNNHDLSNLQNPTIAAIIDSIGNPCNQIDELQPADIGESINIVLQRIHEDSDYFDLCKNDAPLVASTACLAGMPMPKNFSSPNEIEKTIEYSLKEIRQNKPRKNDVSDTAVTLLSNFVGLLPPSTKLSEESKALAMENAINWLHSNDPSNCNVDGRLLAKVTEYLEDLQHVYQQEPLEIQQYEMPEEREKTIEDITSWLENNAVDLDVVDPGNALNLKEREEENSEQQKAGEIAELLKNIEKDMSNVNNDTIDLLTQMTGVPMPEIKTDTKKREAMTKAIEWLRTNDQSFEGVNNHTVETFAKFTGVEMPRNLNPKKQKRDNGNLIRMVKKS